MGREARPQPNTVAADRRDQVGADGPGQPGDPEQSGIPGQPDTSADDEQRRPAEEQQPCPGEYGSALLVLDAEGVVLALTDGADCLLDVPPGGISGHRVDDFFRECGLWADLAAAASLAQRSRPATVVSNGATLQLHCALVPAPGTEAGDGAQRAVAAVQDTALRYVLHMMPASTAAPCQDEQALIRALFSQSHIGLAIHDQDLNVTRVNTDDSATSSSPQSLSAALVPEDAAAIEAALRQAVDDGEPLVGVPHRARRKASPHTERTVSLSALPLRYADGRPRGVVTAVTDITEHYRARQRQALLNRAAKCIGSSLDVAHCAEGIAELLVPDLADLAAVDLTEVVLIGEEPGDFLRGAPMRRVAAVSSGGTWPSELYPVGATIHVRSTEAPHMPRCSAPMSDRDTMLAAVVGDEQRSRRLLPSDATSSMIVPLHARGMVLGSLLLWRTAGRAPFDQQDAELAEEIGSRAALGMDNGRRYARERRTAEALRRMLLPPPIVEISAAEAAGTCLPAATTAGVGGTWFDVIPLSSARVAFVVGDSGGHGLEATAATGRLRTAVRTLADLDLAPEELLSHLDDLVIRLTETDDAHAAPELSGPRAADLMKGSTCLYAVYDPVTGHCTMASAGHPPPAVVTPDGAARQVDCEPGAPLGVSGTPMEPVDLVLEPGSLLACYSGNLVAHAGAMIDRLCEYLQFAAGRHRNPAEIGHETITRLVPEPPADDITLLVTRLRGLPKEASASWEFPPDPAVVTHARQAVTAQLTAWRLDDLSQTTELVASELITNAIRYAGGPVHLRLIKDETLVCEVSDPTQTQPHLRRARLTDEGGRGLFLIHQLTHRWGSRYTSSGKTIWTEQLLPHAAGD